MTDSDPAGEADPTRVVADADVLAADLLVGGPAREALDCVREHSWMTLVASDDLLAEAAAVVADLTDPDLAADWRERADREREAVDHPPGDHPGLASAYRGRAAHLLTSDEGLASAGANRSLQSHMQVSVRTPDAFARLFDPGALYEATHDGAYPGPDRDPRG
jgi:predicted nucleic acid-binding protein